MKKKMFLTTLAVTAAITMTAGLAACGGTGNPEDAAKMSAEEATAKIATFTGSPNTINATFRQTYKLVVNSDKAQFKSFEKDIDDTVTIHADFTAGNLYYYGKKVEKNNSVTEQLVVKEDSTYYYLTTKTVKKALGDEAAAKAKIGELMTSLSRQTAGYVDSAAFVYNANWVNKYLLLGSETITGSENSYFTYTYSKAENDGLKTEVDMKYIGYFGDAGTFEFGTDATHTGAKASVVTDNNGYITSFSQTLNNHLDMNITSPAIPLDLTGNRSLTATYNGALTKKAASDISQTLNNPTVTFANIDKATVTVSDMVLQGQVPSFTPVQSGGSVAVGHWVAVKVTPAADSEVNTVTVGGKETRLVGGQYCYQVTEDDYNVVLKIVVTVKNKDAGAPTTGTIVVANVQNATVTTYDFKQGDFSTLATPKTTVSVGNFVAVKVECASGFVVDTVKVNGADTTFINGYYCLMQAATAGTTYNVVVTVKAAS